MGVAVALAAGAPAAPSPVEANGWAGAGTRGVAAAEAGADAAANADGNADGNAGASAGEGTGMDPLGAD
jgi:hypothetical protein